MISEQQQSRVASYVGTTFLHVKTGRIYTIMGHCMIEATLEVGVLYMIADNTSDTLWVRPYSNFFDGRFTQV